MVAFAFFIFVFPVVVLSFALAGTFIKPVSKRDIERRVFIGTWLFICVCGILAVQIARWLAS